MGRRLIYFYLIDSICQNLSTAQKTSNTLNTNPNDLVLNLVSCQLLLIIQLLIIPPPSSTREDNNSVRNNIDVVDKVCRMPLYHECLSHFVYC